MFAPADYPPVSMPNTRRQGAAYSQSRKRFEGVAARHIVLARYVLTRFLDSGRLRRMAKELTVREMASMGGRARSRKYSKRDMKAWGQLGGRKPKLSKLEWARLFYMLRAGKTQGECAREFNICARTIGRALAKARA